MFLRRLGVKKHRKYIRLAGVSPNIDIVPFDHKIKTLERAVKERVLNVKTVAGKNGDGSGFTTPPQPTSGFVERMEYTFNSLCKLLPKTAPITHQQFVDGYKGRKKTIYTNALKDLRMGISKLEEESAVKVFIKCEKTDRTTKQDPVPRVISPRSPVFNIRLGRYLKPIEERIFKRLGKLFGHKTVMKGMDVRATAKVLREKWEMFVDPVAISLDASRFDQHVSIPALQFEHSIYLECFKQKKHKLALAKLLNCQLRNHCTGYAEDGGVRYTTEGTRMSGDMNTSLGNCVLMCTMIHAYLNQKQILGHLANNGDDCVVFIERADLAQFSEGLFDWFWDMGFNMQIEEPVDEFEKIEFCQCKPVYDGEVWRMCRNPITAIAKDAVLLTADASHEYFLLWLRAIGLGGLSIAGGLPIFQSFYQMCVRNGIVSYKRKHRPGRSNVVTLDTIELLPFFMRETGVRGNEEVSVVTAAARASFYAAFGILPDEQIELERYYDNFSVGSSFGKEWFPRPLFTEVEDC